MAELAALAAPPGIGANAPVEPGTVGTPSDAAFMAVERLDEDDASS